MLNELARVFGSNVLVPPRTGYAYAYQSGSPDAGEVQGQQTEAACDHKNNCSCFCPKFEQASARLELTAQGKAKAEEAGKSEERLSEEQKKQVADLAKRDREVKAHEAAHKAAAGGHAKGGPSFEYQVGPDGRQYAVGGHVDIDAGPVQGNPEATLAKAQAVSAAANAPADPSGQDRAVAAAAAQMAAQARKELAAEKSSQGGEQAGAETEAGAEGAAEAGAQATAGEKPEVGGQASGGEAVRPDPRIRDYGRAKPPAGASFSAVG